MKLMKWIGFCILTFHCFLSSFNGQNLASKLELFDELNNQVLYGHYSNPEDSHYVHKLSFENILSGNAIVLSKEVEELNFQMKIFFFWNPELQQIVFQSLTNKGQLSSGIVSIDKNQIILFGHNIGRTKKNKFKQSFQLIEGNILVDRFYLMVNGEWQQRHIIKYM